MASTKRKRRESFGQVDKLPSGRIRARYTGPDGERHAAPRTFDTLTDARGWLAGRQTEIATGRWQPPSVLAAEQAERNQTLLAYAETWLAARTNSRGDHLRPRTSEEYRRLLDGPLAALTPLIVGSITPAHVRQWRAEQLATGFKTQTSRAYSLLAAIMKTAVIDRLTDRSPCIIKGGGSTSTGRKVIPPTDAEFEVILESIEPRFRALVIVAAMGGLRFGEAVALRAKDVSVGSVELETGVFVVVRLNVSRAVSRTAEGIVPGPTKSAAGVRRGVLFGDDAAIVAEHVAGLIGDRLLFPAGDGVSFLSSSAFWKVWARARAVAGRSDMPFHALRHYAGTRYAQKTGATVREIMAFLGQSTVEAAMRYQHAGNRDDELAARMSRRTS